MIRNCKVKQILHKHNATDITQDITHRFVSDTEKPIGIIAK